MVTVSSSGSSSVSLTVSLNISVAGGDGAVNDGVAASGSDSTTARPDASLDGRARRCLGRCPGVSADERSRARKPVWVSASRKSSDPWHHRRRHVAAMENRILRHARLELFANRTGVATLTVNRLPIGVTLAVYPYFSVTAHGLPTPAISHRNRRRAERRMHALVWQCSTA